MLQKVVVLEISRSHLLTGVAGLESTVCNASKNKLLIKFLKGALKLTENLQEVISNGFPFCKITDVQTTAFNLACF